MRTLLARSYTSNLQGFTDAEILSSIQETTGFDPTAAYQAHIKQGQLIDFATVQLPPGLRVVTEATGLPRFELAPPLEKAFYDFLIW